MAWNSDDNSAIRNIFRHHAIGAYGDIVTDPHCSDDLRARSDIDVVTDDSCAFSRASIRFPDRDALTDITIVTNHGSIVNDNVPDMADIQSSSN